MLRAIKKQSRESCDGVAGAGKYFTSLVKEGFSGELICELTPEC